MELVGVAQLIARCCEVGRIDRPFDCDGGGQIGNAVSCNGTTDYPTASRDTNIVVVSPVLGEYKRQPRRRSIPIQLAH